jgi:hypothetical protein
MQKIHNPTYDLPALITKEMFIRIDLKKKCFVLIEQNLQLFQMNRHFKVPNLLNTVIFFLYVVIRRKEEICGPLCFRSPHFENPLTLEDGGIIGF